MTTVACDLNGCAADTLMDDGGMRGSIQKIHRVKGGPAGLSGIAGFAGSVSEGFAFIQYLKTGETHVEFSDDFDGILLTKSGLFVFDKKLFPIPLKDKCYAIGSGADVALAFMRKGRTPRQSVHEAMQVNNMTGGDIDVIKLEER